MRTGIVTDERFLDHDTGRRHPECADRLRAIGRWLDANPIPDRVPIDATISPDVEVAGTQPTRRTRRHEDPSTVTVPVSSAPAGVVRTPVRISFPGSWYRIVGESGERKRSASTRTHPAHSSIEFSGVAGSSAASVAPPGDDVIGTRVEV